MITDATSISILSHQPSCTRLGLTQVVKVRSQSMAAAAAQGEPHGMLSVVGLPDADLESICQQVLSELPSGTVCGVANQLFPKVGEEEKKGKEGMSSGEWE
jgi:hypothetical protein